MPKKPEFREIIVELNSQQHRLVQFLLREGRFGKSDEQVLRTIITKALEEETP